MQITCKYVNYINKSIRYNTCDLHVMTMFFTGFKNEEN
jgi:hypothetical protein